MRKTTITHTSHDVDVCVIGGGMAGLCAAIASARNGAKTILMHDRPVLGGNASSEVRMWICGAHGENNKESGIVEEIQLENLYRNPSLNYSIWDSVLYEKAFYQPNLTTLLNCSCSDAQVDDGRITSVTGWQLTSQTWHTIRAAQFIDCSGDSILAPLTGAAWREGREAAGEFGEDIQPDESDNKTMGNSLLIQMHRTDEPQPFIPPRWAYRFEGPDDFAFRMNGVNGNNFWWIEVGGLDNTITDAEQIRDELMKIVYGVWDYIKNVAPDREQAAHWAIHWIGSLPGKRENRRYEGDHILTQHDVEAEGRFEDTVAFGGWTMDDHHPAGIFYPGKPTIFHPAPSPYGIPYRCLYSRNIENLLFAGRNISVTHAALSSTRVMGTCAVIGQAAGTAAALCIANDCTPRQVGERHLTALQQTLIDDDCFLPGFTRERDDLAQQATVEVSAGDAALLSDGFERDRPDGKHAWEAPAGSTVTYRWDQPAKVGGVRMMLDSNLNHDKRLPCVYPVKGDRIAVPNSLVRAWTIEVEEADGSWRTIQQEKNNYQRLVRIPVDEEVSALRITFDETWGDQMVRVFDCEPVAQHADKIPTIERGQTLKEARQQIDPADLADAVKEDGSKSMHRSPSA